MENMNSVPVYTNKIRSKKSLVNFKRTFVISHFKSAYKLEKRVWVWLFTTEEKTVLLHQCLGKCFLQRDSFHTYKTCIESCTKTVYYIVRTETICVFVWLKVLYIVCLLLLCNHITCISILYKKKKNLAKMFWVKGIIDFRLDNLVNTLCVCYY